MKRRTVIFLVLLMPILASSQEETLDVMKSWRKYSDIENALYHHYSSQANILLDKRHAEVSKLKKAEDWTARQRQIKKVLSELIGKFPERNPLNAKIIDVSEKEDYSVEKVIYESRQNFYVTAALFIPKHIKGKAPAIVFASGHTSDAFRAHDYQRSCINLVKKGFVVLAFDPIGQGERVQYYSQSQGKSIIGGATTEHTYMGLQPLLIGKSLTNYFVWDGIRAIDYLISRKEVDPEKIGITGQSGGGTQATFIAAFDERIYITEPICFVTSMRRLFESIGPQDSEQHLSKGLANGIDFADFLEVRIPKPALLLTTTRDFFSVQGAMETAEEVEKAYNAFGVEDKFERAEDDAKHSVTTDNRYAGNLFFQKNFNFPGDPTDVEVGYLDKELQITETGQVLTSIGGETVFSLNKKDAEKIISNLNESRKNLDDHIESVRRDAKKLSGYIKPEKVEKIVFTGRYLEEGYIIERYFIKGEGEYPIPFILFVPNKMTGAPILYLNKDGKSIKDDGDSQVGYKNIDTEIREDIKWFIKEGHPVLAADLIGFGEMEQERIKRYKFGEIYGGLDVSSFFASVQLARSHVGIHAGDIQRLVEFIKQDKRINNENIYAVAKGDLLSASLLHAAAFEGGFSKIALIDPLISYRSVVMNEFYFSNLLPPFVPGALTAYDLPDLVAVLASKNLLFVNIRDHLGNLASKEMIAADFEVVESSFTRSNSEKKIQIKKWNNQQNMDGVFSDWLKN